MEFISLPGKARLFQHPVDRAGHGRHGKALEIALAARKLLGIGLHLRDVRTAGLKIGRERNEWEHGGGS